MSVSLLPIPGKGPIVVRHDPEQMDACMTTMDAAIDAYEPIEAAMSELIKLCNM